MCYMQKNVNCPLLVVVNPMEGRKKNWNEKEILFFKSDIIVIDYNK